MKTPKNINLKREKNKNKIQFFSQVLLKGKNKQGFTKFN